MKNFLQLLRNKIFLFFLQISFSEFFIFNLSDFEGGKNKKKSSLAKVKENISLIIFEASS